MPNPEVNITEEDYGKMLGAVANIKESGPKTWCTTHENFKRNIGPPNEENTIVYLVDSVKDIPLSVKEWIEMTKKSKAVISKDGRWINYGK